MEQGSIIYTVLYFAAIIGVLYFLIIRPQQKRTKEHKSMVSALQVGNEIITIGGIHGEVTRIKEDTVWIKVGNAIELEVEKSALGKVIS